MYTGLSVFGGWQAAIQKKMKGTCCGARVSSAGSLQSFFRLALASCHTITGYVQDIAFITWWLLWKCYTRSHSELGS